eukprot:Opistho-2@64058
MTKPLPRTRRASVTGSSIADGESGRTNLKRKTGGDTNDVRFPVETRALGPSAPQLSGGDRYYGGLGIERESCFDQSLPSENSEQRLGACQDSLVTTVCVTLACVVDDRSSYGCIEGEQSESAVFDAAEGFTSKAIGSCPALATDFHTIDSSCDETLSTANSDEVFGVLTKRPCSTETSSAPSHSTTHACVKLQADVEYDCRIPEDSSAAVDIHYSQCPERPPQTYAELIIGCIEDSPARGLSLKDIYASIRKNYAFYRQMNPSRFEAQVRHNLSLHRCFRRDSHRTTPNPLIPRTRGHLWRVDQSIPITATTRGPRQSRSSVGSSRRNSILTGQNGVAAEPSRPVSRASRAHYDASALPSSGQQSTQHDTSDDVTGARHQPPLPTALSEFNGEAHFANHSAAVSVSPANTLTAPVSDVSDASAAMELDDGYGRVSASIHDVAIDCDGHGQGLVLESACGNPGSGLRRLSFVSLESSTGSSDDVYYTSTPQSDCDDHNLFMDSDLDHELQLDGDAIERAFDAFSDGETLRHPANGHGSDSGDHDGCGGIGSTTTDILGHGSHQATDTALATNCMPPDHSVIVEFGDMAATVRIDEPHDQSETPSAIARSYVGHCHGDGNNLKASREWMGWSHTLSDTPTEESDSRIEDSRIEAPRPGRVGSIRWAQPLSCADFRIDNAGNRNKSSAYDSHSAGKQPNNQITIFGAAIPCSGGLDNGKEEPPTTGLITYPVTVTATTSDACQGACRTLQSPQGQSTANPACMPLHTTEINAACESDLHGARVAAIESCTARYAEIVMDRGARLVCASVQGGWNAYSGNDNHALPAQSLYEGMQPVAVCDAQVQWASSESHENPGLTSFPFSHISLAVVALPTDRDGRD